MFLKLSKWFLLAAFFAPVVVLFSTFFPFIGGKYYFFRAATELGLVAVILWWGFEAHVGALKARLKKLFEEPIVVAVTIFVGIFLLACLFANDTHAAWWSNFERGEGGFQMLHYYLFFLLSLFLLREEKEWKLALRVAVIASACMVLYGIAAAALIPNFIGPYMGGGTPIAPTFLGRLFGSERFQGSLGNPAYVAPYLMFALFYMFFLWGTDEKKERTAIRAVGYVLLGFFFLLFFILSQTRGAFIGVGVGVVCFLVYLMFSRKELRKKALIALAALAVVGGTVYAFRHEPAVERLPGSRLLDISLSDQTAQTRFWTWGSAWKGFVERPLLGWGPENFSAVFDKYFDSRHYIPGVDSETWFDRAHSVVFDYLAETGILGFVSYIAMFAAFFWQFVGFWHWKKRHHGDTQGEHQGAHMSFRMDGSAVTRGLLLALPIAYLVQGLAIFDVLPMYINLFFFFALASYIFSASNRE